MWVNCRRDLNSSLSLLVLERTILNSIGSKCVAAPVEFDSEVGVWVECRRDLNVSLSLLVLQRTILNSIGSKCVPHTIW